MLICVGLLSVLAFPQDNPTTVAPAAADKALTLSAEFRNIALQIPEIQKVEFNRPNHATFRLHGWTVHLNKTFLDSDKAMVVTTMLKLLSTQLERVVDVIPEAPLQKLRSVAIWINPTHDGFRPGCEYHPDIEWLRKNGRDPAMSKSIEVSNVDIFEHENRRMPYLMLHELAHAFHDQVLGFEEKRIIAAFATAKATGSYDSVKRFTGNKTVMDKAYAISNHKEYFAESTEAYFGRNDFFPFDRDELRAHDPIIHELLPLLWKVRKQPAD